ncbi:2405_t:CDS:2 [Paraglomus occultum]|uniref:2405_t:CDS:1 n=1 Tax=Paraglomus occultum TaxID=144539 RepID=A0A9N9GR64_9GLOM|nr:2405_t:CDS:2 [Paraglomus occultum]
MVDFVRKLFELTLLFCALAAAAFFSPPDSPPTLWVSAQIRSILRRHIAFNSTIAPLSLSMTVLLAHISFAIASVSVTESSSYSPSSIRSVLRNMFRDISDMDRTAAWVAEMQTIMILVGLL